MAATNSVLARLRHTRRRSWTLAATRAALLAAGGGAVAFTVVAAVIGPTSSIVTACLAWATVILVVAAAVYLAMRGQQRRLADNAELYREVDPELPSRIRTVVELSDSPATSAWSAELAGAHAVGTLHDLNAHPVRTLLPAFDLIGPAAALSALLGFVSLIGIANEATIRSGVFAILHPDAVDGAGHSLGIVVGSVSGDAQYPSYQNRKNKPFRNLDPLQTSVGSILRLRVQTLKAARKAEVTLAGRTVSLHPESFRSRTLLGEINVVGSGPLEIKVQTSDGNWVRDSGRWTVEAIPDRPPNVKVDANFADSHIEPGEELLLPWEARDDFGLAHIDLVTSVSGAEPRRERLAEPRGNLKFTQGFARLSVRELGVAGGDDVHVWLEARDENSDVAAGIGRSVPMVFRVATRSSRQAEYLASLQIAVDAGVDALADRLESKLPTARPNPSARRRFSDSQASAVRFLVLMEALSDLDRSEFVSQADINHFRSRSERLSRLLRKEASNLSDRRWTDLGTLQRETITALEENILDLDLRFQQTQRGHIQELVHELRRLQESVAKLLERAQNEGREPDIDAAKEKISQLLAELERALESLRESGGEEFLNLEALSDSGEPREPGTNPNEQQNEALTEHLDQITDAMKRGRLLDDLVETPEPNADALQSLEKLLGAQAKLLDETGQNRSQRGRVSANELRSIRQRASEALDSLRQADPRGGGATHQQLYREALQRTQDLHDALTTNDLQEGQAMAELAQESTNRLATDLRISARMFPGADNATGNAATAATEAAEHIGVITATLKTVRGGAAENSRGNRLATTQAQLSERVDELLEQMGPENQSLQRAAGAMRNAATELENNNRPEALHQQRQALDLLYRLTGRGSGASLVPAQTAPPREEERVIIPEATAFVVDSETRRGVVQGMDEEVSPEYRRAVRAYLEELLR